MKTNFQKMSLVGSVALICGLALNAGASVPAPLSPSQLLSTESGKANGKTPAASASRPAPTQAPAARKMARKIKKLKKAKTPVSSASAAGGNSNATSASTSTAAAVAIDKASVIAGKCKEIERLSPRKTAVACLDKILDREDIAVGDVSTRIYNCRELRKVENNGKDALVEAIISGRMWNLAFLHRREVAKLIEDERQSEGRDHVGPRKVKEIELRAAYEHETAMRTLADSVCDRQAFAELLTSDSGIPQIQ